MSEHSTTKAMQDVKNYIDVWQDEYGWQYALYLDGIKQVTDGYDFTTKERALEWARSEARTNGYRAPLP